MCLALNHWFKKAGGPVLPSGGQLNHDLHTGKSVDPHLLFLLKVKTPAFQAGSILPAVVL